jgi:hypothetical protein
LKSENLFIRYLRNFAAHQSAQQHSTAQHSTAQHSTAQHSIGLFFRGDGSMGPMAMTHGLAPCPKFSEMSISLAVSH